MSYLATAKKPGRPDYVIFRGEVGSGSTLAAHLAGTRDLNLAAGTVDGRMRAGHLARAIPEVAGGRVQRPNMTLELLNHDGALDRLIVGTTGNDPDQEFTEASFLSLRGKVYHGVVDEAGLAYEAAISPTLRRSGSIQVRESKRLVVIPLAFNDEALFGESVYAFTVRDIAASKRTDGVTVLGAGLTVDHNGVSAAFTQDDADKELKTWAENLEAPAHFLYGKTAVPLMRVAPRMRTVTFSGQGPQYFAFASLVDPVLGSGLKGAWVRSTIRTSEVDGGRKEFGRIYKIERWVKCSDGVLRRVWIVGVGVNSGQLADQRLWFIPFLDFYGVGALSTPANIIKAIVSQHSPAGAAAVHDDSFAAASEALPVQGAMGGLYTGDTPVADIVWHYANPVGFALWPGLDDKLRVLVNQAHEKATPGLPVLGPSDVLDALEEEVPAGSGQRGAPATRTTIDWTQEQREYWTPAKLFPRAPGSTLIDLGQPEEVQVSGAVLYPPDAGILLAANGASRAFVTRKVTFRTHLWVATYELGQLFLFTHRHGLEVAAPGGYQGRLLRLLEVAPELGRRTSRVTFEDLGSQQGFLRGVLDDLENWVARKPVGVNLELTAASAIVETDVDFFIAGDVGKTLVTRGALNESNRGPNRKITAYTNPRQVTVNFAYPDTEVIASSPNPTDAIDHNWILMKNHSSEGATFRDDYIRSCQKSTSEFLNGDRPYRYLPAAPS